MTSFDLSVDQRQDMLQHILQELEQYYQHTDQLAVTPPLSVESIRQAINEMDLVDAKSPRDTILSIIDGMKAYAVHTPHPMYFGLFNPRSNFAGILADLISAYLNPQLAAWSHAPFAAESEAYLVRELGIRFGYARDSVDGVFASGGAEANMTALISALHHQFPEFGQNGLRGLLGQPYIYVSQESHHSVHKAAKMMGLGMKSVRTIPVKEDLSMDLQKLEKQLIEDRKYGIPTFLVGTGGTTGAGSIDPLDDLADIARAHRMWFHVDAAYGGAVVLNSNSRPWLSGIEKADSITFDIHKWLSVPMAASVFITRHKQIMHHAFGVANNYMPKDGAGLDIVDPYYHSMQWSRRFIGLKLLLSLAMYGWKGMEELIQRQVDCANDLREALQASGWRIENETPLPIICFSHEKLSNADIDPFCQQVIGSGETWISVYPVNGQPTLRACINNYNTGKKEVNKLVALLNDQLEKVASINIRLWSRITHVKDAAMITRIWHGKTSLDHAGDYLRFLQETGIKDYLATPGNLSVKILREMQNDVCHFYTVTEWESLESIKQFAGQDFEKARYYKEDEKYLLEFEETVKHYETFVIKNQING